MEEVAPPDRPQGLLQLRYRLGAMQTNNSPGEGTTTDDNAENEQLQNMERELAPAIDALKRVGPFVILLLLRFISENAIGMGLVIAFWAAVSYTDRKFREQVTLKTQQSMNVLLILGAISLALIVLMYVSVAALDSDPIWRRFLFIPDSSSGELTLLTVLWKAVTTDLMVQMIFMIIKIAIATGGHCKNWMSSSAPCHPDCRYHSWRVYQLLSTSIRSRTPVVADVESGESSVNVRWSNIHDHHSEQSANTNIDYMRKKRLLNLIDAISKLYRLALPAPFWFQYYSAGQTAGMFVPFYLFFKARNVVDGLTKVSYIFAAYMSNQLEHGRYATREELAQTEDADCTICYDRYRAPVILQCGHIFCEDCISEWLDRENSCPVCRAQVPSSSATTNFLGLSGYQRPVFPQVI